VAAAARYRERRGAEPGLYILKARGIAHSNQIREFLLTNHGVELREVYLGEAGLLTGSGRVTQEAKDASAAMLARQEIERKQLLLQRKRRCWIPRSRRCSSIWKPRSRNRSSSLRRSS